MFRAGLYAGVSVGAISAAPGEATTPNFGLWEPWTIGLVSGVEEYPIVLEGFFPPEALSTDYVRIQVRSLPALAEVLNVRILVGTGNQSFPGLSGIDDGSHAIWQRLERGPFYGDWTNSVEHGPDAIAPVLILPTGVGTGTTTATLGVTTGEGNGTLYWVVTTSATKPTAAQIKAGQSHSGAAAADDGSLIITTAGAKTAGATGLADNTAYYAHFMHEDAEGNQSTVVSSASFATDVATPVTLHAVHEYATQNVAYADVKATFTGGAIGSAQANRRVIVAVTLLDGSGTAPTGVTVNGIAATLVSHSVQLSLWRANVPSGTTATVEVTSAFSVSHCGCSIASIRTGSPAPTEQPLFGWSGWSGDPPTVNVTTPTNGLTLTFAATSTMGATISWSNATEQTYLSDIIWATSLGTRSTAGAATVTAGGFIGDRGLLTASWGP